MSNASTASTCSKDAAKVETVATEEAEEVAAVPDNKVAQLATELSHAKEALSGMYGNDTSIYVNITVVMNLIKHRFVYWLQTSYIYYITMDQITICSYI